MADNSFSAGNLSLSIGTIADDTLKKLDILVERLSFIEGSLKHITGTARQSTRGGKDTKNSGGKSLLNIGKWTAVIASARRFGRFMGNIVQAGSDYTETLNLWQVAMRDNIDVADEFINKMNKAYGISSKTLMNAQATFKNMIGSLGQISDATAYAISEALVQMSADFSSLYNVQLESAFEKMQSMLAGQVRPIRSAGLDMTETTLYMFYQQLGGTKTMRQLNRTEKQLLSILAVYKQMGSAGALGDMTKTLNSFANQIRLMTEYWAELKVWSGLILKDWLEKNRVLVYINAALITMTEIFKAIAKSKGLGEENFITGMLETVEDTNDAVDELQGKLLDFDKFRALEDASGGDIGIDQKLLEAITGYSSQIDKAQNAAQELADTWLEFWLTDDGNLTKNAQDFLDAVKEIGKFVGILISVKIGDWIVNYAKGMVTLTAASKGFSSVLLSGIIYFIWQAVEAFREGDIAGGIIATTIGVTLVAALVAYKLAQYNAAKATTTAALASEKQSLALTKQAYQLKQNSYYFKTVAVSIGAMVAAYGIASGVINQFEGTDRKIVSWAFIIVGAITAVTAAIVAMNTAVSWGTALPVLLAGVGAAIAGVQGLAPKVDMYATGASDIDSGTLFVAGEMGKTEMVYNGTNGKTNVANVQQIQQAMYNALVAYGRTNGGDKPIEVYLDGEKVYENTTSHAKRRGNVWSHA